VAEGSGFARLDFGISDDPAITPQEFSIPHFGRMNIQRDLELVTRSPGKFDEFPEFVNLETKRLRSRLDWAVGAPPAGYGGEWAHSRVGNRPLFEHHRRTCRPPLNIGGRNAAIQSADIFPHGEVKIMSFQMRSGVAGFVPKLGESGIQIDVGFLP